MSSLEKLEASEFIDAESTFKILADGAPVLIWVAGTDKLCTYFNKAWLDFTGRTMEQELGNGWAEGVHPEDLQRCLDIYVSCFDAKEPFSMEYRLRHNDGTYHWLLDNGASRFSPTGEFLGYIGSCVDVSSQKNLEREREQYLKFFQLSVDAMCIADPYGCLKHVNPALSNMLGFSESELVAKPFLEFITPEDRQRTADEMKQQVEVRSSLNFENHFVCKDGTVKLLSWMAYFDKNDGITYAIARDITEHRRLEMELKRFNDELARQVKEEVEKRIDVETERTTIIEKSNRKLQLSDRKFRQLFTEMPTGFALHEIICNEGGDPIDYRFLEVNPAFEKITGLKAEDVIGKTALQTMPLLEDYWIQRYGNVALTGHPDQFMQYAKSLGKYFEVSAYSPTENQFASTFYDVTERELANEKLKAFNEELQAKVAEVVDKIHEEEKLILKQSKIATINEIISSLAHHWRQPLNIIGLDIQDIAFSYQIGELSDEYMRKQKDSVMDQVNYLSKTIDNFRNFFRPQDDPASFYCADVIKRVSALIGAEYKALGICLNTNNDRIEDCQVFGFENDLAHAILNIISNSKDAITSKKLTGDEEGEITITAVCEKGHVEIKIQDNGAGIDNIVLDKVFMPYFSTKSVASGTGMGLYFSKMIIEGSMGGKLDIKNANRGALVTITIPCLACGTGS
jgi:PAS domain S-box-containing protein